MFIIGETSVNFFIRVMHCQAFSEEIILGARTYMLCAIIADFALKNY